jgi:hypothetical protein
MEKGVYEMAEVTSGKLTAVILSSGEAEALGDLLVASDPDDIRLGGLDDLANALAGHSIDEVDEAVQARPVIPMVGLIPSGDGPSTMPGAVTAAFSTDGGDRSRPMVEIWLQSPTGDASDSQIFRLDCASPAQADMIAAQWRALWSLR